MSWEWDWARDHTVGIRPVTSTRGAPRTPQGGPSSSTQFATPDMASRKRTSTQMGAPTRTIGGTQFVGSEGTQSYWVHNRQASDMVRRKIDTLVGPMISYFNAGVCRSSTIGKQGFSTIHFLGDFTDLNYIKDVIKDTYPEISDTNTDRVAEETAMMYVLDMDSTTEYCNMTNVNCWLTIYDLVKSGSDRLNVAASEGQIFQPASVWENGVNEQRNDSSTFTLDQLNPTNIGAIPTDSLRFSQEWHIHQHTRVCLSPGQSHQHHVRFGANSFVNFSDLERTNAGETAMTQIVDYLKGTTYAQLAVYHGCPCPNADASEATYTKTDLCIITHKRYRYKYALGDLKVRTGLNTLDTTIQAGPNTVNPLTGAIQAVADAIS